MGNETKSRRKTLQGVVKSDKMDKTVVVEVSRRTQHRTYKKFVNVRQRYKAHDEKNECLAGDLVEIVECRPLSREKRWRVSTLVERPK